MKLEQKEYIEQIEKLRQELNYLVLIKGMIDSEVVLSSQRLDQVLNEYHQLVNPLSIKR